MGDLPPERHVPLESRRETGKQQDGWTLDEISYRSYPGDRVPAYLMVPDGPRVPRRGSAQLVIRQIHAADRRAIRVFGIRHALRLHRDARLHGAEPQLTVVYPEAGHDFPDDARERAYGFLAEHLM